MSNLFFLLVSLLCEFLCFAIYQLEEEKENYRRAYKPLYCKWYDIFIAFYSFVSDHASIYVSLS